MVTTYKKLNIFKNAATFYLSAADRPGKSEADQKAQADESDRRKRSKLGYALRKVVRKVDNVLDDHKIKIDDLREEHCKTGEDGTFMENENGGYKFTPKGSKDFRHSVKELNEKEITIQGLAYFASEVPKDISPEYVDEFKGFVIDPEWINEDDELVKYTREEQKSEEKKK